MTRRKTPDHRYEASAIWVLLQHFPGARILEAPLGMKDAVLKIAQRSSNEGAA